MENFLIGLWGDFDYEKYERDFKRGFFGVEACMFQSEEALETLVRKSQEDHFNIGIHFPLRKEVYKYRDPLLFSLDQGEREEAFAALKEEIKFASEIRADYILMHFPKPVIINENLRWDLWRFGGEDEWVYEKDYPQEAFRAICEEMFIKLSKLSNEHNVVVVLEFDAVPRYIYEGEVLTDLLKKNPDIKVCLDTGRLYLLEKIDPNFSVNRFIRKFLPFTYLVHLSNTKVTDKVEAHHYPPLPQLQPSEGWADIASYLRIIAEKNNGLKILFEHRSDLISDEELEECYQWVNGILKK